ncbi:MULTISPECIES: Cro/CI family transcriptional regulator [Aeromonas]|uniref:Cro/CI family transcriptional regulator n=1 Tax=Aeromonas TaxID=642 RepID=UPI0005A6BE9D|nr:MULTISPECIES: Cro/CI family transcriptional regulator [Aeromonas]MCJ7976745.1 Cro/Cl family transcriptional regulator [Aeromonas veronii]UOR20849.1 Cro/CI family transcriptional regulator [Aeromonas veronii]
MKKKEVISHFGNMSRAMKAIGIARSVAVTWGEVVPAQHAVSFVIASNGELRLGLEDYSLSKTQDQAA